MFRSLFITITLFFSTIVWSKDLPTIRLGALEYGTVNWELDTIKNNKLDEKLWYLMLFGQPHNVQKVVI